MRARFSATFGAVLVLAFAAAPPSSADSLGPVVLGPATVTAATGNTGSGDTKQVDCPSGSVLTTVTVGLEKITKKPAAASAGCAGVRVDAAVSLGAPSAAGTIGSQPTGGSSAASACAAGSVVVGFVGTSTTRRGGGIVPDSTKSGSGTSGKGSGSATNGTTTNGTTTNGKGGSATGGVDALQVICRALNPDGTLASATTYGAEVGKVDPYHRDPDAFCPDGAVATGIAGAVAPQGSTKGLASFRLRCRAIGFPSTAPKDVNVSWITALPVAASSTTKSALTAPGQERWFRFPVQPGQRVTVSLTDLAADYDLVLFKDIGKAFTTLTSTDDLTRLSAEFAGDAYSPSVFSPSVFSPSVFSPSVFSPSVFSPSVFSPSVFSPSVFSPSVFSPSVFSPSVFSPSVFSPSVFSPSVSLPSVFSPSVFSPSVFSPSVFSDAFASAQTRSVIATSAHDGLADETISSATWNNTGDFYVRVQGRNGVHSDQQFQLQVSTSGGVCSAPLDTHAGDATLSGTPGSARTVILTDPDRLPGTAAEKQALAEQLRTFAGTVGGKVVDLGDSAKVRALNAQADGADQINCPYAKNLVAEAARDIVNSYRDSSGTLQYVVIVGDDSVVPFFRYPDAAGLGPESDYSPPVSTDTASEASLKGNYVLSQDAYGSHTDLSIKGADLPLPDLSVGRLVEAPTDITAQLRGFVARNGQPLRPNSSLTTGYDFLTDAADAVQADFTKGIPGGTHDTLITDADVPPSEVGPNADPRRRAWTADDLRTALLGKHHDLVFLAGHFSANNALAADYSTTLDTTEVAAADDAVFRDSLVFSAGCHSGYTIVDADGVPHVTVDLDWTEAFAKKGATLIAGTGYQYGDTDFLAYSEQLYAGFAHELRVGSGPVAVGDALVAAKQRYLRTNASLGGIDQKTVLEATLYGLPMLGVDLPSAGRVAPETDASIADPQPVAGGAGGALGLTSDDIDVSPTLQQHTRQLTDLDGAGVTATYLSGPDGTSTSPGEPALPLADLNVSAPGQVLRGVGLRSATYTDTDRITPLTGSPATETHGVHGPFVTSAFYPNRLATPNYYHSLTDGSQGATRLMVTPAQHRSDGPASLTDTLRRYSDVGLRLFYSKNIQSYGGNTPALAAPPGLTGIASRIENGRIEFSVHVVGDPSAGIQQVWVTYTGESGGAWHGKWQSLDLTQDADDSTLWTGSLAVPSGQQAGDGRFLVQAVNGVGLVGIDDNQGRYFIPGVAAGSATGAGTTLTLDDPPASASYGDTVTVRAVLTTTANGAPLADRPVTFSLGAASRTAFTNASGVATVGVPIVVPPGSQPLLATYDGDADTAPASSPASAFTVRKQATTLTLTVAGNRATATLVGHDGQPLREKAVYLALVDGTGTVLQARTVITDRAGRAVLDLSDRPAAATAVKAWFGDASTPVPGGQTVDLSDPLYGKDGPVTATVEPEEPVPPGCTIVGTPGDDVLKGTNGDDVICGLGGNDTITGGNGNDTIYGGSGNDVIDGGNGNDIIDGGPGNDTITGGNGKDTITGGSGNDTIKAGNDDDSVDGGDGNDVIDGGNGNDRLTGGAGIDRLTGGNGDDFLDVKDGKPGDVADGGNGKDTAVADQGDTVTGVP
ncbi:Ig-like domain repeat protein [Micropruina sp.]|uniref:Ig-like domain repeat protein n=1 Tax=Micropruina sp. TaxID=2737536 RepID=UPI0026023D3A|nr:Ig-like domain repeat protein [Micropruina sp.]